MAQKANNLQKKTIKMVENLGGTAFNIVMTSKRFTPDILACINGRFFAFEIKTKTDNLSFGQEIKGAEIENSGGYFLLITEDTDFTEMSERILESFSGDVIC